jgi:hypothetical protein
VPLTLFFYWLLTTVYFILSISESP